MSPKIPPKKASVNYKEVLIPTIRKKAYKILFRCELFNLLRVPQISSTGNRASPKDLTFVLILHTEIEMSFCLFPYQSRARTQQKYAILNQRERDRFNQL